MSIIVQEIKELKDQIFEVIQQQTTLIQQVQQIQKKLDNIEATLEMVSEPCQPKTIELIRDKAWK